MGSLRGTPDMLVIPPDSMGIGFDEVPRVQGVLKILNAGSLVACGIAA